MSLLYPLPPPSGLVRCGCLQPDAQRRLMLGGAGDRGLGVEDDHTKGQLIVQEKVELLVHQEL